MNAEDKLLWDLFNFAQEPLAFYLLLLIVRVYEHDVFYFVKAGEWLLQKLQFHSTYHDRILQYLEVCMVLF